jgi:hypothetical protein
LDGEALIKYSYPKWTNFAVLGGVAFANTPDHQDGLGVAEAVYEYPFKGFELYGNAKLVSGGDTTLFAVAVGGSVDIVQGFQLIGDFTLPFSGKNTYSTSTGNTGRDEIYGVALRYTLPGHTKGSLSFDAGITNGLGGSTGFSLTPSLSSSVGLFVAATCRF